MTNERPVPEVSIVIVSMNKPDLLADCLDSIAAGTTVTYEALVVAYLYTDQNLRTLRTRYPWATLIESREVRGFSENNNLALRCARGRFCFVLNDDTVVHPGAIDRLTEAFATLGSEVAITSPLILDRNGEVAFAGRGPLTYATCLRDYLFPRAYKAEGVRQLSDRPYPICNVLGAAFMIRTDVFREIGWFDEYYFFTPEDIAVSTEVNRRGYRCYLIPDARVTHLEGLSSGQSLSMVQTATAPAGNLGTVHFVGQGRLLRRESLRLAVALIFVCKFLRHRLAALRSPRPNNAYILSLGDWHTVCALFARRTPKETFIHYYRRLQA